MSFITDKQPASKVHFSEYIRTANTDDGDANAEESTQPEQPKAE